jgi:hypothetical protein
MGNAKSSENTDCERGVAGTAAPATPVEKKTTEIVGRYLEISNPPFPLPRFDP